MAILSFLNKSRLMAFMLKLQSLVVCGEFRDCNVLFNSFSNLACSLAGFTWVKNKCAMPMTGVAFGLFLEKRVFFHSWTLARVALATLRPNLLFGTWTWFAKNLFLIADLLRDPTERLLKRDVDIQMDVLSIEIMFRISTTLCTTSTTKVTEALTEIETLLRSFLTPTGTSFRAGLPTGEELLIYMFEIFFKTALPSLLLSSLSFLVLFFLTFSWLLRSKSVNIVIIFLLWAIIHQCVIGPISYFITCKATLLCHYRTSSCQNCLFSKDHNITLTCNNVFWSKF